jgi:hypothetical protein
LPGRVLIADRKALSSLAALISQRPPPRVEVGGDGARIGLAHPHIGHCLAQHAPSRGRDPAPSARQASPSNSRCSDLGHDKHRPSGVAPVPLGKR